MADVDMKVEDDDDSKRVIKQEEGTEGTEEKKGEGVKQEDGESNSGTATTIDIKQLQNKKFKAADLPLTTAQRQSIDGLLYRFKKGGDFDVVRKKVWAEFAQSVRCLLFFTISSFRHVC